MPFPIAIRRARLLDVRSRILTGGNGALHIYGNVYPGVENASPDAPLVIRSLASADLVVHPTDALLTFAGEANAALAGSPTWARFVDGSGATVLDCSAGLPGSGAHLVVSDGQIPPGANFYPGGVVTFSVEFVEP
jgi:hypothetical protein